MNLIFIVKYFLFMKISHIFNQKIKINLRCKNAIIIPFQLKINQSNKIFLR